ncbi:thioredoxin-like protein [Tribonema minus]|uniref:Thioredoxin-like protein n=1 Tax=Tribonema minus TaxID=303371 RepID=A0A835Z4Q0_9STRA|nr:thioredoxin-like protein [Tribonema minus]
MMIKAAAALSLLSLASAFIVPAHLPAVAPAVAQPRSVLQSTSDGQNLRPDVAEQLELYAAEAQKRIDSMVKENKVMLFMKGNKMFPQCGFSNTAVQVLRASDVKFETFDVLSDPDIRQGIKEYSQWPTIPQLYVGGEFVGGSDILIELFQNGELKTTLESGGAEFVA